MKRTRIARGKPLERKTPLRTSTQMSRTRKLRESEKARERRLSHRERMDELRPVVFARDNYRCQVSGPECNGHAEHAHHLVLRSRGGPDTLDNLLSVCHLCHGHVHANVAWSTTHGYIRSASTLGGRS